MKKIVRLTAFSVLFFCFGLAYAETKNESINQSLSNTELPLLEFDARIFPEVGSRGMVVTQESRATQIGVDILNQGGNAIDAAVAVGFALAVSLPRAGNIGGGGFMMIYDAKTQTVKALDYRETAPQLAHRDMFLNANLEVDQNLARYSLLSSGVPGTVAGLVEAHKKYGKLPFAQLVQPAIRLAQGLPINMPLRDSLNSRREYLSKTEASRKKFTHSDNRPWEYGDVWVQPALAQTLARIAKTYGEDFYRGETAKILSEYFSENGGMIRLEDLNQYRAVWREPVKAGFTSFDIYAMPPPSSGGIHLVQLLNIVNQFPIKKSGANSAYATHVATEAMKFAYADRSYYLGDPDFVSIPVDKLVSNQYAERIASRIDLNKVIPSQQIKPGELIDRESPQTTHFSIMDADGNTVSNTYTLNFSFGSGITVPGIGVLMNNEMDDFSSKPGVPNAFGLLGGEANAIQAKKRPLSSMTPVIVLSKGKPWIATGSPGGSRIITIVFNFLVNRLAHGMNIAEATLEPRIHHQWFPDTLFVENGFPSDTAEILIQKGHKVEYRSPWGSLQSIEYRDGVFYGFSDPRRPGAAAIGVMGK